MRLADVDRYFRELLRLAELDSIDDSLNGIQVECSERELATVAFAVDACMASFERAAEARAELLFVHHGLFWGRPLALTRGHHRRVKFLVEHDMALYAAHLPLDLHPELGNNAGMAAALGLEGIEPFGIYRGAKIGLKGRLPEPADLDGILRLMGIDRQSCVALLPFGPQAIRTVGIVSGGATHEVDQAIAEGLDLYITGEASHTIYHTCLEERINLLCGGHYQTEVWGLRLLARRLARDTGLRTLFVDVPTGL